MIDEPIEWNAASDKEKSAKSTRRRLAPRIAAPASRIASDGGRPYTFGLAPFPPAPARAINPGSETSDG
jgi:hypothetical protein